MYLGIGRSCICSMALFGYWLNLFLQYALDIGEPVNVLEAFVVVEHHHKSILFLAACCLLIVYDYFYLSVPVSGIDWIFALCVQSFVKRNLWNIDRIWYTDFRILITTGASCRFISHGKSHSRICHRWRWRAMESCSFVLRYHIDFGTDFFVVHWTGRLYRSGGGGIGGNVFVFSVVCRCRYR